MEVIKKRKFDMKIFKGFKLLSVFVLAGFLVLGVRQGYAQNFGDVPYEKEEIEMISEDDINDILASQGVPLVSASYFDGGNESTYTLGITDVVDITVSRHAEVSGRYEINGEGKIQYEFVGDIPIDGLTKKELTALLVEKLSKFIVSPEVLVKIAGYNSKMVYVIGEVGSPGKIPMTGDTITIREALVEARLPLLTAKAAKSVLITPSDDGKPRHQKVDVHKLLYEGDLRENLVMEPGDTLFIPPTIMAKALRVIQPVTAPVNSVSSSTRRMYTGGF